MFDNGYIFTNSNKRIFLNTSLGCLGGCCYCYLSKLNYSNNSADLKTVSSEYILNCISKNNIEITPNTLITLGCYSECWDEANKPQTIKLIKHFLKLGNQIQLSTKKQIKINELKEILPLVSYKGQLVIFVSCATISMHDGLERNTTPIEDRFKNFELETKTNIPFVLYIKPVLKNITIKDLPLFKNYIKKYNINNVVVGSIFTAKKSDETVHFSNKNELFYNEIDDEQTIINELTPLANIFKRSSDVMKKYKQK